MNEEELENIIAYIDIKEVLYNKHPRYCGGIHAYTYLLSKEGKKQLTKGTPTTNGYYVGNNKKVNTVVAIFNYITLMVTNSVNKPDVLLTLLKEFLTHTNQFEKYKNICFILKEAWIQKLLNTDVDKIRENDMSLGKLVLDENDLGNIVIIQNLIKDRESKGNKVLFDFDSAVEGGEGNKLSSKVSGLGLIETRPGKDKRHLLNVYTKKEYEEPESDFNKIVTAGRWYFNTGDGSDFYDLQLLS